MCIVLVCHSNNYRIPYWNDNSEGESLITRFYRVSIDGSCLGMTDETKAIEICRNESHPAVYSTTRAKHRG